MSTAGYLDESREKVDQALNALMPREGSHPERLVSAMRHSLFAGGKRIRPILVLAAAAAAGGKDNFALQPACAVELVHTYSLIHDDLPAMDDDDFRRGRPTCHRAFDEGTAILAGDALLTMAFDLLSVENKGEGEGIEAHLRLRMVQELARAAGWRGMVGGQQVDMDSEGTEPDLPTLEYIHTHKTGALIRCSLLLGGLAANADETTLRALASFGEKVGLAFQVVDDILDVIATTEEMGKDQGSDAERGKITYPGLFGLEGARERAFKLVDDAKAVMDGVDSTGRLAEIADYVLLRRL
ncbi:polyprenyl synthetase family protein [bacterium]|nr:polyprenyl synthetase family protein [bacterium]